MALAPDEAQRVFENELRRLAVSPWDLTPRAAQDDAGDAGYLHGVGFDLAVVLPVLARLPNGAGLSAVRHALDPLRVDLRGVRVESTDRPS